MYIGATVADPQMLTRPCATVNASSIPDAIRKKFVLIKSNEEARHPGFNKACNCYFWGYRPEIINVIGLGSPTGANDWRVCMDPQTKCPVPPPPVVCPTCPKPPPCPTCPPAPACPTCPVPQEPASGLGGKFGPTLGVALAAAIAGAGGFYMWKKLRKKGR